MCMMLILQTWVVCTMAIWQIAIASRFMNNTAGNSGGVLYTPLYHYAHVINLKASYFINNSGISGGAIAMLSNGTVTVTESILTITMVSEEGPYTH